MRIQQKNVDLILKSWRSLNAHVLQLNQAEVEQLLQHELKRSPPRMQFVLRIHSRLTKLSKQAMDQKRLRLIRQVRARRNED